MSDISTCTGQVWRGWRGENVDGALSYKWWYIRAKRGHLIPRYLSYRTRGIAVILTIEYCSVVRWRSCASRETMANDNPYYYSPKETLSMVMLGHWTRPGRVHFHARSNLSRLSPENNARLRARGRKDDICTRSPARRARNARQRPRNARSARSLFSIVSVDVLKSTRNPNESAVPNATRPF